jgi:hypothetical protein
MFKSHSKPFIFVCQVFFTPPRALAREGSVILPYHSTIKKADGWKEVPHNWTD